MKQLTPREIVAELDRFIIGQDNAKRAVAVAVRNRWRRRQLDPDMAREVAPKNIIMIGPTGVGKTEIARRLANLVNAPFIKVEASKYTEVGYHGRDVESMVRDLLELAVDMVRSEHAETVREQAEESVESRLVSLLLGEATATSAEPWRPPRDGEAETSQEIVEPESRDHVRNRLRDKLREGIFEEREIEITIQEKQIIPVIGMMGPDQMDPAISSMLENLVPSKTRHRRVTVARARAILLEEETDKLIDNEKIIEQAIERTEEMGIIFLDEIDKIATPSGDKAGSADVSRQGVQRDLLPIVEGSAVNTRYGVVHTDQILFIAAGAFHSTSVSDLMPELQGRFPIRVELNPLTKDDFKRILVEPDSALTKQQQALLATEGLTIEFKPESIDAMAELAAEANNQMENIGARRLMTVMECVFEQISFDAPDFTTKDEKQIEITAAFVRERLTEILKDEDLSKFVL
ncbi:MAG: ATP-dependent protease ATPase subunit HslU [Planctomycetes bacterium]|nr:ATP-dependent protease ATPase subunit HslU [Planctomycetota bacterium]MCH8212306.1 ATP-dependent protease ATPase subunit HslU [Planctomycetota bacterium]MCH8258648.1 ATP-dependent protease ATPase subunit HslU [Planctomycetota bacterium]